MPHGRCASGMVEPFLDLHAAGPATRQHHVGRYRENIGDFFIPYFT